MSSIHRFECGLRVRVGKLWSDSDEREPQTTDGGKTWAKILKAPTFRPAVDAGPGPKQPKRCTPACGISAAGWDFRSGRRAQAVTAAGSSNRPTAASLDQARRQSVEPAGPAVGGGGRGGGAVKPNGLCVHRGRAPGRPLSFRRRRAYLGSSSIAAEHALAAFYFANLIVDPSMKKDLQGRRRLIASSRRRTQLQLNIAAGGGFRWWIDPEHHHLITGDDGGIWYSSTAATNGGRATTPHLTVLSVSVDMDQPYASMADSRQQARGLAPQTTGRHHQSSMENMMGVTALDVRRSDRSDYLYAESQGAKSPRPPQDAQTRPIKPLPRLPGQAAF